mmetsp:Transcript_17399/g.48015  ORF Transcript_17399/g.48015 Transcript_17399/m.48015 type:complete len:231 (-) Transcript_17399:575-1267(-)
MFQFSGFCHQLLDSLLQGQNRVGLFFRVGAGRHQVGFELSRHGFSLSGRCEVSFQTLDLALEFGNLVQGLLFLLCLVEYFVVEFSRFGLGGTDGFFHRRLFHCQRLSFLHQFVDDLLFLLQIFRIPGGSRPEPGFGCLAPFFGALNSFLRLFLGVLQFLFVLFLAGFQHQLEFVEFAALVDQLIFAQSQCFLEFLESWIVFNVCKHGSSGTGIVGRYCCCCCCCPCCVRW